MVNKLPDFVASFVSFYKIQPFLGWVLAGRSQNFNTVAVFQLGIDFIDGVVDFYSRNLVPNISMNGKQNQQVKHLWEVQGYLPEESSDKRIAESDQAS